MTAHASITPADRIRTSAAKGPAIVGAILGNVVILGIVAVAALVVPIAAAITFGPSLLALM